jgi:alpha-aminoadipic semialdehyde synthase
MYWDQRYPRLITNKQMKEIVEKKKNRLLGVGDVTCDFEGSIQFLKKFTTPDNPFFVYNPITE